MEKKGKNKMTEKNKKRLYYLTQYADYMTDEQFLNKITNLVERYYLDIDLIAEISELMTKTSDKINKKLFNELLQAKSNTNLFDIIDLLNAIIRENSKEVAELLDVDFWDFLTEREIYTPATLEEIADEDLRANGINANALYWVKEIDYGAKYQEFNGYANGFNNLDDADIIEMLLDEYL